MSFFHKITQINSDDWTITKKTTRTIKHENFSKMKILKIDKWALSLNHHKLVNICIRVKILPYFFSKWKLGSNTWQVLWFTIAYTLRRWLSANKHQAHIDKIWVKWLLDNWIKSLKTIVICLLLWQHHTVPITSAIVRGKGFYYILRKQVMNRPLTWCI